MRKGEVRDHVLIPLVLITMVCRMLQIYRQDRLINNYGM